LFSLFAAWFPGGATLSRPYLRRFPPTRYYVRSDSSAPPDSRRLRSLPFGVQVEVRSLPLTVRQFDFGLPPFSSIFLIPGSFQPESERGAEVSPDQSCYFLSALSRTTPGFSRMRPLTSRIPARGFITTRRLAFHRCALYTDSFSYGSDICLKPSRTPPRGDALLFWLPRPRAIDGDRTFTG
jgi:hypothetical protein